jgi:hypothetical protein
VALCVGVCLLVYICESIFSSRWHLYTHKKKRNTGTFTYPFADGLACSSFLFEGVAGRGGHLFYFRYESLCVYVCVGDELMVLIRNQYIYSEQ